MRHFRAISAFLAICISLITTAFLSLVNDVSTNALIVTFVLSFSSSYLLIFVTLEFLVFREIDAIHQVIDKLKRKELSFTKSKKRKSLFNPFKTINQEIFSYADLKQKEIDELKKMAAFRREFIADVSHELKTPIFAAQGFVHTLLEGAVEDKEVRYRFLKKAAKSLDGLDMLVQDLLTISQMETGQTKVHYETFDIVKLTQEVFDLLEGEAEKKKIQLILKVDNTLTKSFVYADSRLIFQVMQNLVSNAIKYTREGGQVEVTFKKINDEIKIVVKDNGRGIPAEHLDRIFERFYRVEKSRSRDKGGTGLGLAIVKHIVEAHNTSIQVDSKVKEGSTFSFTLKAKSPQKNPSDSESPNN